MKTELESFDGLDNRREIMIMLTKLGTDVHRARFLQSLIPRSRNGFMNCPVDIVGPCDPVTAYFIFISICNELGVSINEAAARLNKEVG